MASLTHEEQPVTVTDRPYALEGDGVALRASRCQNCRTVAFPEAQSCSDCGSTEVAAQMLPTTGELWSWTTQSVRPKSPPYAGGESVEDYRPFFVGYVQLDDGVCVEGRLVDIERAPVIGALMRVVERTIATTATGEPVVAHAFAPLTNEEN